MIAGRVYGLVGALSAVPRRLVAKAIRRQGGEFQHRVTRRTTHVVFGRALLDKAREAEIEALAKRHRDNGRVLMSENALLRALAPGDDQPAHQNGLSRQALTEQAKIAGARLDLLALFDAFETDREPHSFRDLILARKYAGLLAGGATWLAIARSIHRYGPVSSLTALSLHAEGPASIYARLGDVLTELDGQGLLPLDAADDERLEELFAAAEQAEGEGRLEEAAALYERCLAIDQTDAVAAFNLANCVWALGDATRTTNAYLRTVKLDPKFVEAWFNFAGSLREQGKLEQARRHLRRALAIDPAYADAVFNLATLEFDSGSLGEAHRWWTRYLTLDASSEWADQARKGIQYIEMQRRTAS